MMRMINADALLTVPNVRKVTEYDETGTGIDYLAVPVEAIEKVPTIDAVPVVRCKDCLNRMKIPDDRKHYFIEGCFCCALGRGDPTLNISVVMPDDYCSAGVAEEKMDLEG